MSSQSGMDKREHNQKVLSILPNDVWIQIFTFFNEKELCRSINRVCKQFYELSEVKLNLFVYSQSQIYYGTFYIFV